MKVSKAPMSLAVTGASGASLVADTEKDAPLPMEFVNILPMRKGS